jgi:uncharacterized integral membrane protein (TIGR00698 family)
MNGTTSISLKKISSAYLGVLLVIMLAAIATFASQNSFVKSTGMSPVVLGIIVGMIFGNTLPAGVLERLKPGTAFAVKYILRTAIIFYGFRITFQNILEVGAPGLLVSVLMVTSTLLIGIFLGVKVFKMDTDLVILTASGSAICGAAAVVATESVLKADQHKSIVAISTVVLFGTISMFVYPALCHLGILNMSSDIFGIYIGGSIHEVAQVVVAGNAVNEVAANNGVIVKMTRVMLLVPVLLSLGFFVIRKNKRNGNTADKKFPIPYFVLGFILVAGINSLTLFSSEAVTQINTADTFLLTMAMCALGMGTTVSKVKEAGAKPIYLASLLFVWLLVGGYFITKLVTGI